MDYTAFYNRTLEKIAQIANTPQYSHYAEKTASTDLMKVAYSLRATADYLEKMAGDGAFVAGLEGSRMPRPDIAHITPAQAAGAMAKLPGLAGTAGGGMSAMLAEMKRRGISGPHDGASILNSGFAGTGAGTAGYDPSYLTQAKLMIEQHPYLAALLAGGAGVAGGVGISSMLGGSKKRRGEENMG